MGDAQSSSGTLRTIGGRIANACGLGAAMILAALSSLVATIFASLIVETTPRKKWIAIPAAG
jgi:hypothetical protein